MSSLRCRSPSRAAPHRRFGERAVRVFEPTALDGRVLAGEGDKKQWHDRTDGERDGDQDGFEMNVARRAQDRDRREDGSRTRYEYQTQRQTDNEPAARTAGLASDHSREWPFQPLPDHGITKPKPTSPKSTTPTHINVFWGRCNPDRISEPMSTRRLKLTTSPRTIATERRHEPWEFQWRRARPRRRRKRWAVPAGCRGIFRQLNRPPAPQNQRHD